MYYIYFVYEYILCIYMWFGVPVAKVNCGGACAATIYFYGRCRENPENFPAPEECFRGGRVGMECPHVISTSPLQSEVSSVGSITYWTY